MKTFSGQAGPSRPLMEHGPDCWKWGQHHYECAKKKIEELTKHSECAEFSTSTDPDVLCLCKDEDFCERLK